MHSFTTNSSMFKHICPFLGGALSGMRSSMRRFMWFLFVVIQPACCDRNGIDIHEIHSYIPFTSLSHPIKYPITYPITYPIHSYPITYSIKNPIHELPVNFQRMWLLTIWHPPTLLPHFRAQANVLLVRECAEHWTHHVFSPLRIWASNQ